MPWSEKIKNLTREKASDGVMVKNEKGKFGFYFTDGQKVTIKGVRSNMGFPLPTDEVLCTFADIEAMIDAGWVID